MLDTFSNLQQCEYGLHGTLFNVFNACAWDAFGVNPGLVWALYNHESGGQCDAVSVRNAQGAGQFVGSTWRRLGNKVSNSIEAERSILHTFPARVQESLENGNSNKVIEYLKSDEAYRNVAVNILKSSYLIADDSARAFGVFKSRPELSLSAWKWGIVAYHVGWIKVKPLLTVAGEPPEEVFTKRDLESHFSFVYGGFGQVKRHYVDVLRGWPYADELFRDQARVTLRTDQMSQPVPKAWVDNILTNVS